MGHDIFSSMQHNSGHADDIEERFNNVFGDDLQYITQQDKEIVDQDLQRSSIFEQRKALAESNYLTQSRKRNRFSFDIGQEVLDDTDDEISRFTDQIAYITVSKNMAAGKLPQFLADKKKHEQLVCDETMLLAALFGTPAILKQIAQRIGKTTYELAFPDSVVKCRKVLLETYERRTFQLEFKTSSNHWFHYAAALKSEIEFTRNAKHLLHFLFKPQVQDAATIGFDYDNLALMFQGKLLFDFESAVPAELVKINKAKSSIFSRHRQTQKVKQYCQRFIKGQEQAISAVTDMVASAFAPKKSGPMGIATFMGIPGTGKTALAETLADSLNDVYRAGYRKLVLNMEMYSDERSGLKLFGTGSQYIDSALGDLTTEVFVAPRTVIVIDEIEKAHRSVIQSLLTLLEKGQIADQTTNQVVDFSQCFIIFTTNLGHKAAAKSMSQNRELDLKSLLAEKPGKAGLSPELISRLARCHVALFRELTPSELLNVAEQAAAIASANAAICWPDNMAELIIETLGGNLEPRAILSQAARLETKILDLVCSSGQETDTPPRILVDIAEDIADCRFAVVTKDLKLKRLLKKQFASCVLLADIAELSHANSAQDITAVLVHQPVLEAGFTLPKASKVLFYSFALEAQVSESLVTTTGIEKGYLLSDYTSESLHSVIQQATKRSRLLAKASDYRKRKMAVEFDYQLVVTGNTSKVTLQKPVYEQRFTPDDFEPVYMQEPCVPDTSFKDLIGLDELKQKMSFVLQRLRGANDFVLDMPKGYLLAGLPGTGKSYFAKAVAGECQVPFIPVNSADLMQGDVIANINHLFDVAERYAPCIVFLDEIDAIALNREQNNMLGRLAVNTLLTRLDGFNNSDNPVFVLAATNHVQKLDPAVMRFGRFDKVVTMPLPDLAARTCYIQSCAKKYNFQLAESALTSFAKRISGASFGFIKNLFRDVQLTLQTEQRQFSTSVLDEQLLSATIGDKKAVSSFSDKARLAIAYHETGHYLLSKHWYPKAKCTSLSIQEHEAAGGVTVFDYDGQDMSGTKANFKARLQILLAGRAAEKLLSKHEDDISTGASHDLQQATQLARKAITSCGFSDSLGLADFSQLPMLQPKVEAEVLEWLNKAYNASEAYLRDNWSLVTYIAEALFDQEVLDQEALDQAIAQFNHQPTPSLH